MNNLVGPLFHINNKFPREELTLVASTTTYVIDLRTKGQGKMVHFDNGLVLFTRFGNKQSNVLQFL